MAGWGWDVIKHIWTKWGHPGWPLGPIMGHFRANNGYFHHISTIYWCYLDGVVTVTSPEHPGWYRIPYNKFWQGLVIQSGQWDQLWVISEPKMASGPNYGPYQPFPEIFLIVLQLAHAQSMEGWGWVQGRLGETIAYSRLRWDDFWRSRLLVLVLQPQLLLVLVLVT